MTKLFYIPAECPQGIGLAIVLSMLGHKAYHNSEGYLLMDIGSMSLEKARDMVMEVAKEYFGEIKKGEK